MPDHHQQRLARLRAEIAEREFDQLLVTNLDNVRYLSGFTGTNGTLLVGAADAFLLTDFRYVIQAGEQAPEFETVDGASEPRKALAERFAAKVGFDDADMRVQGFENLKKELAEGVELVPASGAVEQLRTVKDDGELDVIARAAAIADSIYATLAEGGLVGRSEKDVAWRIEWLARERGAEGISFPPIVAAGAHGALPHAEPRDRKIEPGELVVLDLGVVVGGYCSDCTRTFATGPIAGEAKEVYEIVRDAQQAALEAIAIGADCKAVDAAARDLITQAGYGEQFGHSTGHGVGVEVHELPTLSTRSETALAEHNVVTVEPGIYVDGEFGVRIEDLVVVADDGPRILTPFSKELTIVD
ncbi:MAG: M24 family metallopeptidase [Solirubrobacterales bacterium]